MSDESIPENKPAADNGSQSSVASARKVIENTELVTGSPRQIVDAGLLGTCLLFLAAMLGVQQQQIDTPLTIALVAFAVAIPILVYGFTYASYKAKPAPGSIVLEAMLAGAWIIEAFGWLAVSVGVFAVIAHLSILAFKVSVLASILVVVLGFSGSFIGLIIYAVVQHKKQEDMKQDKTTSATSGDAPSQAKEATKEASGNS